MLRKASLIPPSQATCPGPGTIALKGTGYLLSRSSQCLAFNTKIKRSISARNRREECRRVWLISLNKNKMNFLMACRAWYQVASYSSSMRSANAYGRRRKTLLLLVATSLIAFLLALVERFGARGNRLGLTPSTID